MKLAENRLAIMNKDDSYDVLENESAEEALVRHLRAGKTKTFKYLAEKAVVMLEPSCGKIIWSSSMLQTGN